MSDLTLKEIVKMLNDLPPVVTRHVYLTRKQIEMIFPRSENWLSPYVLSKAENDAVLALEATADLRPLVPALRMIGRT